MQKTLRGPMRDCCSLSVTTRSAASTNFEHAAGAVGVSGAPFLIPRTCAPRLLFLTSRLRPTRRCQGARVPARVCGGGQRRLRSRRSSLCAPPGARSPPHDAPETVQNWGVHCLPPLRRWCNDKIVRGRNPHPLAQFLPARRAFKRCAARRRSLLCGPRPPTQRLRRHGEPACSPMTPPVALTPSWIPAAAGPGQEPAQRGDERFVRHRGWA